MKEAILILALLGVFVLGYFLMARLDRFLDENRKAIKREHEKKEPSCVMLTEEMSEEEIAAEVRRFREKHESTRVVLYDGTDADLSASVEYHTHRKQ